ncbi:MAG: SUMF1/EgtB/PvdO family nonheme iron enzyme [Bacteroidales bacterium]|jgi:serine/threonine-protein kinase|nr:SUMF1/EgtB/PvdO family nonheme iron enzyme [Bacteroidales bacterium]
MDQGNIQGLHELQSGTILCNGKYTIQQKIGEGGFGITYKAIQSGLNRTVCIKEYFPYGKCMRNTFAKTIHPQGISEVTFEKYRQAFVKEAKTIASFDHPNIVKVIDIFDENNTSYMVMPFIEGKSLQQIVTENGKLSYNETVNYIAQITNAVGYIHKRHILHRDIKPDNIMITADHKAILIDFGSAREFEQDKTQIHTSMLTHGYAPTEQYTANSRKGSYTDIYALGGTFYFAVTGKVPVEAAARLTEKMPEPKELSPAIPYEANRTILKAMQIKPENRHQTIQEFMDDLRNVRPSTLIDERIGSGKVSKWLWLVPIIAVIIIVSLVLYFILKPDKTKDKTFVTKDFTGMNLYPMIEVDGGESGDFYIGQYEVSQGFWKAIMGSNPSLYQPKTNREGQPLDQIQKDSYPVENVNFDEIQEFILRLNQKTKKKFSLPTEAEWEYAARGGNKAKADTKFGNGKRFPANIWFKKERPFRIKYSPSVNELGIYQMSGNVAEWCEDYYDNSRKYHVVKGGSFNSTDAEEVSITYRDYDDVERGYIGFRLIINK